MGYRSQVVLAVSKKVMPQFMSTMAKSPEAREMCFAHVDRLKKDYDGEGAMLFYWDHIKWYDSYSEIRMVENLIECMEADQLDDFGMKEEELPGIPSELFKFVRIGEDNADVEQRGYGFENIYVTRSITF